MEKKPGATGIVNRIKEAAKRGGEGKVFISLQSGMINTLFLVNNEKITTGVFSTSLAVMLLNIATFKHEIVIEKERRNKIS